MFIGLTINIDGVDNLSFGKVVDFFTNRYTISIVIFSHVLLKFIDNIFCFFEYRLYLFYKL